jgi:hypothetical protein
VDQREESLLPSLDNALQDLRCAVNGLEQEFSSLEQELRRQLQQRDLMLKALAALR